jgi:hypothetical protein
MMSNNLNIHWFRLKQSGMKRLAYVDLGKVHFLASISRCVYVTLIRPPLNCSLNLRRESTTLFTSRPRRRPKSLNIVEPPDNTIFYIEDWTYVMVHVLSTCATGIRFLYYVVAWLEFHLSCTWEECFQSASN